jgi:glycosyltransferase involved in cell wall biosynthesis
VVTVHDLGFLHFQDEASPGRYWREHLLRARAVVTVSEFSAAEVRTALGGRVPVHVIPNGVAAAFTTTSPPDAATARRLRLPAHYVLHLGGVTRRKNLGALVEAWRIVHAGFPDVVLAMAGPDDPRRISAAGRTPGIVLLGVLPPAHLPSVVAGAAAVVVPSLYEGFGLPLLEAMAAGIPVVASARAALPEVAGGDAVLVEPTAEGLAEGLALVLEGGTALEARVRAGVERAATFSWERAARAHLRLYLSLLSTTP